MSESEAGRSRPELCKSQTELVERDLVPFISPVWYWMGLRALCD